MAKIRWLIAFGCLVSSSVMQIGTGIMTTMIRQKSYKEQLEGDFPVNQINDVIENTSGFICAALLISGILVMLPDIVNTIKSKIQKEQK